jgi:hypothetical protein
VLAEDDTPAAGSAELLRPAELLPQSGEGQDPGEPEGEEDGGEFGIEHGVPTG